MGWLVVRADIVIPDDRSGPVRQTHTVGPENRVRLIFLQVDGLYQFYNDTLRPLADLIINRCNHHHGLEQARV